MIANVLYLSKDIEKWGSGIRRIHEECHNIDVKVEFKPLKTGFMTVFNRRPARVEELGENEKGILALIKDDRKISIVDIAEKLGISTTAVENNIKKLKDKGLVERKGPAKGGYWSVK